MAMARLTTAVPVLPVRDTAKAAAYYADRLGFTIVHADTSYAVLDRDDVQIHLWAATDTDWVHRPAGRPVVSGAESFLAGTASCRVAVEGIEVLFAAYQTMGVLHPNAPLSDKPYGLREFAVLDGDGNLITFFQPIPEAGR